MKLVKIPITSELILKSYIIPKKTQTGTKVNVNLFPKKSDDSVILKTKSTSEYSGETYYTNETITTLVNNKKYFELKSEYIQLVNYFRENMKDQFVGGMPVQLEADCLSQLFRINPVTNQLVYSITLKVDGERFLLFIGSDKVYYFIDRSTNFYYLENESGQPLIATGTDLAGTILDGELTKDLEYLIFDVLFDKGKSVMYSNYSQRYLVLKQLLPILSNLKCSLKTWFPITDILSTTNIYKFISDQTNKGRKTKFNSDGLILQPNDGSYVPFREWNNYNNVQFKWKPPEDLTIDFKIKIISKSEWHLLTGTDQVYMINQEIGNPLPATCYPTDSDRIKYQDGDVIEFTYQRYENPFGNLFKTYRLRNEKKANSYKTIMSTLRVIHNPINLDSIKGSLNIITSNLLHTKNGMEKLLTNYSQRVLILWALKGQSFFSKSEIESINNVYSDFEVGKELEFRIFTFGKKDQSMDRTTFFYLLGFLYQSFQMTQQSTIDLYLNTTGKQKFRSTYSTIQDIYSENPIENMKKENIKSYLFSLKKPEIYNNLVFKMSLSTETDSERVIKLKNQIKGQLVTNLIRTKTRYSFIINELWRLDLTRVKMSYSISELETKNENYEFECEYIGKGVPFQEFIDSYDKLWTLLLLNCSYC